MFGEIDTARTRNGGGRDADRRGTTTRKQISREQSVAAEWKISGGKTQSNIFCLMSYGAIRNPRAVTQVDRDMICSPQDTVPSLGRESGFLLGTQRRG